MYIIYWTVYYGQKMPRNYISSTTLARHQKGYLGSVSSESWGKIWKSEVKNNPHLFKSYIIEYIDGNRNDALTREECWQRRYKAAQNPLFINLAYAKFGFFMDDNAKAKIKQTHLSKTIEEITESNKKQMTTKMFKSDEEKSQRIEKLRIATLLQHQNMTPEMKAIRSEKIRNKNIERCPSVNQKIGLTVKSIMENRSDSEWEMIKNKKKETWRNRTENGIKRKSPEKIKCSCGLSISPSNFSRHVMVCDQVSSEHLPLT